MNVAESGGRSTVDLEPRIERAWASVLGRTGIGRDENFFDAGGDSVKLLQLREEISTLAGRDVRLRELMEFPTVRALAVHLQGAAR